MQFSHKAHVYTMDRHLLGHISHVVLDPIGKQVTHIVVHQGAIRVSEKVVPVEWFATTSPDGAILREDVGDIQSLPDFEEVYYSQIDTSDELEPANIPGVVGLLYTGYSPTRRKRYITGTELSARKVSHHQFRDTKRNIPTGAVALEAGGWAMSADGHHVGEVESVFVDPQTHQITGLLIVKHTLLKVIHTMIEMACIGAIHPHEVYLGFDAASFGKLPNHS